MAALSQITLVQMQIKAGNMEANVNQMISHIEKARSQNQKIVIFPAHAITGQELGRRWEQASFLAEADRYLEKIVLASKGLTVIFGHKKLENNLDSAYTYTDNKTIVAHDGNILTTNSPANQKSTFYQIPLWQDSTEFWTLNILTDADSLNLEADLNLRMDVGLFQKNVTTHPYLNEGKKCLKAYGYINAVGIKDQGKIIQLLTGKSLWKNAGESDVKQVAPAFEEASVCVADNESLQDFTEQNPTAEIYQSLRYGAKYFLEQLGLKKVIIGLSGGMDSALTACIYRSILEPENILLVNMPSQHNSKTTKSIAKQIADGLGCWYGVVPIEDSIQNTLEQLKGITFEKPGESPLTLNLQPLHIENLQARDRTSRVLSTLSGAFGGVFTCNGNKSEIAVGYGTLYGDGAGFFGLLGDLWKTEVFEVSQYIKDHIHTQPILPDLLFTIPPSAELSANQAVEKGLGDPIKYPYHDRLFAAFVERTPSVGIDEILEWYHKEIIDHELGLASGTVARYFTTPADFIRDLEYWWKQYTGLSVAKRLQAPPVLALSSHSFGLFPENQVPYFETENYRNLKKLILNQ